MTHKKIRYSFIGDSGAKMYSFYVYTKEVDRYVFDAKGRRDVFTLIHGNSTTKPTESAPAGQRKQQRCESSRREAPG